MMIYKHVLHGCAPSPLAGYLKALGVFRIIAEQADPDASGFWCDERFVLKSKLSQDEIVQFLAETYEPSLIISPWNGRAGFLEGEDKESNQQSSRKGAELVRRYRSAGDRFKGLRNAVDRYDSIDIIRKIDNARKEVKDLKNRKPLSDIQKSRLKELEALIKSYRASAVASLRSEAPDEALGWFDACQRITRNRTVFPLLGAGGLDGSRDFGMSFGSALEEVFDLDTGNPFKNTTVLIRESLGIDIIPSLGSGNPGQYDPAACGENITSGFKGEQPFNPVDFIFIMEGVILFSGATTRRLGSHATRVSFPFTVDVLTAGSGAAVSTNDNNPAEFWAPIWMRPACLGELSAFLAEGRTTFNGKTTKDGLEFAVALKTLGSQRGVPEYERFALLQREPKNPRKATPLGRVRVRENPRASLIADLDAGGWLSCARRAVREKSAPASLQTISRKLDETLFGLAGSNSPEAVQEVLIAIGALMLEVGRRSRLSENLRPPRRLSANWAIEADDGSHEFALAAALASLDGESETLRLPFRRHLAPLDGLSKLGHGWGGTTEAHALVVWGGRDLVRDMQLVLERRLIESQRHHFQQNGQPELPLRGWSCAPLAAVAAFLAGRTDDSRIAALAAGLAWMRSDVKRSFTVERTDPLSFAYAALKPLFAANGVGPASDQKKLLDPLVLVRLIGSGRIADAVTRAQGMAKGAGLATPFARSLPSAALDPGRLAAALLFPITPEDQERLIARAYPELTKNEENANET